MMDMNAPKGEPKAGGNRISLFRLDKLMLGESASGPNPELEREAPGNPELARYLGEMRKAESPLHWAGLRQRIRESSAPAKAGPRREWRRRLLGFLPSLRQGPRMAFAGAIAFSLLALPLVFSPLKEGSGFRAKGAGGGTEVRLEINGARLAPGRQSAVHAGDIMAFAYRSATQLYVRVWYREAGGALNSFAGKDTDALVWPAASGWSNAPQRIRLEGEWKSQNVIIVTSHDPMSTEQSRRFILDGKRPGTKADLFTFELQQP